MKPTYHIVSHSHWDREWYKSFQQFRAMLVNMVDDLLDLLHRDPTYACFTLDGQAIVLEDYLAVRPERAHEIRELVQQGRLIIGPWYVLPDEFLVSAEATVRNLLEGMRICREFGGMMNVGYIPDSFGHIAMMPALLRGFGLETAVVYRGFGGEPDQTSSEYWWTAPDGSRVLMIHLFRHGYSSGYFHQDADQEILSRFAELKGELDARATTSHRLLLNGGDHHWPDPKLPATLDLLRHQWEAAFIHSTIPRYVESVRKEIRGLPVVEGELRFGYRYAFVVLGGVYSSRMYLKQANWKAQNLLQRYAEPLNGWLRMEGKGSQLPLLRQAWKTLMQNHPHDSICGCSIDPVHREMMARFKAVEDIAHAVLDAALEKLIPPDDRAARDDRYLFLWNPSPHMRTEVTPAELRFYLQDIVVGLNPDVAVGARAPRVRGFALIDAGGREVPFQILSRDETYDITYSRYNYPKQTYAERFTLLVEGVDVPPVGFKGLRVERRDRMPRFANSIRTGKNFIQNDFLRVEVNARGEVTMTDTVRKKKYRRLNVFESSGDVGDEYNYSYPARDRIVTSNRTRAHVTLGERGPLRASLVVRQTMTVPASASPERRSRSKGTVRLRVTSVISLSPSSRSVVIETTVDNRARDHRFRALVPTGIKTDRVLADAQFCMAERQQKKYDLRQFTIEHPAKVAPMQRFVAVRNAAEAFVLLSDGLPEYELLLDGRGTLALTLLRCVGLLAGEDLITRPGGKAGWHNETPDAQCQGTHTFRYALLPMSASAFEEGSLLREEAERFHLPLLPVRRKNESPASISGSMLSITGNLTLSALKETEDGRGVLVRVTNPGSTTAEGALHIGRPVRGAWVAMLNEHPLAPCQLSPDNSIPLTVKGNSVMTVRIEPA